MQAGSLIAASREMSPVGMSKASSNTFKPMPKVAQIWFTAAPPAAKFSSIARVTDGG